jgi:hypothetical protein
MQRYTHVSGTLYLVMDGVRRAKAARMFGHSKIPALVVDASGQSLGEGEVPIDALRSPKNLIRRLTAADERRWHRIVAGAKQEILPYPPITVQPGSERPSKIEQVGFDSGDAP